MYGTETMTREEFRKARREQVLGEQRRRRQRILIFCITLIVMFGAGVGFCTMLSNAEEKAAEPSNK